MVTEVIMKREILGEYVSQKSKSGFFCATDFVKIGNKHRVINGNNVFNLSAYFYLESTKVFIKSIENKYGLAKTSTRGKRGSVWVHPLLFIDIALAISPDLKLEVYEWINDNLLKYRNDSGDSYKKMVGAVSSLCSNKAKIQESIIDTAQRIKVALDVEDWNTATAVQLNMRDKIHESIFFISGYIKDIDTVIDASINHVIKNL